MAFAGSGMKGSEASLCLCAPHHGPSAFDTVRHGDVATRARTQPKQSAQQRRNTAALPSHPRVHIVNLHPATEEQLFDSCHIAITCGPVEPLLAVIVADSHAGAAGARDRAKDVKKSS